MNVCDCKIFFYITGLVEEKKNREKDTLEQGLKLPVPSVAEQALPAPLQKPDQLQIGITAPRGFTVMDSTVGQSKKGRRRLFPVQPQIPAQAVQVLPIPPARTAQKATSMNMPQMLYSTVHYRKK